MAGNNSRLFPVAGLTLLIALVSGGCMSDHFANPRLAAKEAGPEYQPENYHQSTAWLPRDVRRVAVLPVTTLSDSVIDDLSRDRLEQVLASELTHTELFEVTIVAPEQLRRWTGRTRWSVTDPLPPDFFARIHNQLGCDAVLFAHLTAYRPYPPMAMGWKLNLVDAREPQVWWASDVFYDTGNQLVAHSAIRYERENQSSRLPAADPATILRSPGRFGQYTLAASLGTLQRHEKNN
jgi:hypothetical protein